MKKILAIMEGYFPAQTYGGPPVSIDNLCSLLSDNYDFYILTSDHELNRSERLSGISEGWNDRGNCKVMYLPHSQENKKTYDEVVKSLMPDIIYINSLFYAGKTIPFLKIAKKYGISLLLAPRGELCVNAFNKKYKKLPYLFYLRGYLRADNVWYQSTSEEEDIQIEKILHVSSERIFRLTNVPKLPSQNKKSIAKEEGKCKLIFISRIDPKKNIDYGLRVLQDVKCQVEFDIYGPKEDVVYWQKCEALIKQLPDNVKAEYKGALTHDQVNETFSKYHAFLFPTLSENYGHVLVESMLAGCPVITSDQVPWTDVNDTNAGWSMSLDNSKDFVSVIERLANMNQNEFNELSKRCVEYILNHINVSELREKYIHVIDKIISAKA